jgi:hypothetical protein
MPQTFNYSINVDCTPENCAKVDAKLRQIIGCALADLASGGMRIAIDYPVTPRPHWTERPHAALAEMLAAHEDEFVARLSGYLPLMQSLRSDQALQWKNGWFEGLDAVMAYCVVATHRPKRLIEIGSGFSTTFMAAAKRSHSPQTVITSIDPHPRAEIDALCDRVIRHPVEDTDLAMFRELERDDVLFIDSSHRVFTNSDVTTLFLDVIPYLKPGVIVQVHDIFLPWDYPTDWSNRYYSEQYLLAAYLLGGHHGTELFMPVSYVSTRNLVPQEVARVGNGGVSFWLRTV